MSHAMELEALPKQSWPQEELSQEPIAIEEIENKLLQGIFACRTSEAVEAALTYARFLNMVGITPEIMRQGMRADYTMVDRLSDRGDASVVQSEQRHVIEADQ